MIEKMKKMKDENKILVMLAVFSIAMGLWGNFRQLWLQDNNLTVGQISKILSLATFLCAGVMLLIMFKIKSSKIKKFISFCLIVKVVNLIILYICNHTGQVIYITIGTMIDIITEKVIITAFYPLLITIRKSDKLYSKRKLVEYLFRDVGILIGGIAIGRVLGTIKMDYNFLLLISILFLVVAYFLLQYIKQEKKEEKKKNLNQIFQEIRKDSIVKNYLACYFVGSVAMSTGLGLKMLMLTNIIGFSAGMATNFLLVIGLLADGIGILALKYLTPKNDYITITIKFGIRFFSYLLVFLSNSMTMTVIAIIWSILISTAYENKTDAVYINRVSNENQMVFTNIRYLVGIVAEAIGLFFAGLTYNFGIRYMLGLSAFFMIFQLALSYQLIHMRKKEGKVFKDTTYENQGIIISFYQNRTREN